jgi:hypothetical protein
MKKLSLILILAVLAGCAGTTSLQSTLEDRKGSLIYVHDSEKVADKKSGTLALSSFTVEDVLAPDTIVTRKSSFFLPLIFFNMWKQEDQARLGYAQLENDYKQFLRESFIEEVKRSGTYSIQDGNGDVSLEVKIKQIEMSAPINQHGNFIFAFVFFAFGTQTTLGPVDVSVDADVQASKGGAVVLTRELKGRFRTNILAGKNVNMRDYTTAMIEGVSMAVKDLNEKIVKEINKI